MSMTTTLAFYSEVLREKKFFYWFRKHGIEQMALSTTPISIMVQSKTTLSIKCNNFVSPFIIVMLSVIMLSVVILSVVASCSKEWIFAPDLITFAETWNTTQFIGSIKAKPSPWQHNISSTDTSSKVNLSTVCVHVL